jgi:hypothetical protein
MTSPATERRSVGCFGVEATGDHRHNVADGLRAIDNTVAYTWMAAGGAGMAPRAVPRKRFSAGRMHAGEMFRAHLNCMVGVQ